MQNELLIPKMDRYAIRHALSTFKFKLSPELFPERFNGDVRIVKECVDMPDGRAWVGRVFVYHPDTTVGGESSPVIGWEQIGEDEVLATVDEANLLDKKFRAFAGMYHAMRNVHKPSCTYVMANRVAQHIHDNPDTELVDFIDNDMFMNADASKVEVITTLEVVGAKYMDLRRIDTLVVSRKLDIGISGESEILCTWPVVICGKYMSFNQFIPGPVLSLGNLTRQYDVGDINTKDLRYVASTPISILEQNDYEGTVTLRKQMPNGEYITFKGNALGIFPANEDDIKDPLPVMQ